MLKGANMGVELILRKWGGTVYANPYRIRAIMTKQNAKCLIAGV